MKNNQSLHEKAVTISNDLDELYPEANCSLTFDEPYQLMIAARLSAQCTDTRVNLVTKEMFTQFPTLEAFANASESDLEEAIRPCGFYRTKAHSVHEMTQRLLHVYGGVLPDTMEELLTLPGVGRKTANLLLGDVYGKPAVVADTHCIRIAGRMGLTKNHTAEYVEADLRAILPPERSNRFCHQIVLFGREYCRSRSPHCNNCPLTRHCVDPTFTKRGYKKRGENF